MTAESVGEDLSFETNLSLTTLAVQDVVYKGEGNANIVIALPHERRVIRFRKSLPDEVSPDDGKTRVQREVWYARNVVSCFLGSYAQIPQIVRCDAADVVRLSDAIRPHRPEKRQHKVITDTYATKFPDYTFLDLRLGIDETVFRSHSTFCVEIKPKQGYLPKAERKFPVCPYCLNQYAKLRKGDIAARSNYCPFELFSGAEARMKTAVKELVRSPQNNLRIFKDGIVVYNQESSLNDLEDVLNEWLWNAATTSSERARRSNVDEFCSLVYAALTRPFAQEQLEESSIARCNFLLSANQAPTFCAEPDTVARAERYLRLAGKNCNFNGDELPRNSVLERIRNMQQLSYVNTNYIYGIYSDVASSLNDDTMYDDLMKLRDETHVNAIFHALPGKFMNAVIQKTKYMKEVNSEALLESNNVAREYDDNSKGNSASSKCILSSNVKRIVVNGDFTSQIEISANLDSRRLFYGDTSLHNQKTNDDDEQETNMQIIAKHLSTLRNYLLFATARDCSILMTFRELHPENLSKVPMENTIKLSEQLYFLSSVRVSDLDPKSVHSIKKHRQRDVDIFDSVISLLEDVDDCQRNDASNNTV